MSSTAFPNADALTWFSGFPVNCVFLSPHSDDICFSLGGLIIGCRLTGTLVTLFSQSVHTRQIPVPVDGRESLRDVVTRLRRDEDESYASSQGFSRIDFGFPEPAVRGIRPFGPIDRDMLDDLRPQFLDRVVQLSKPAGNYHNPPVLFTPLGVGRHVDHLWVKECVATNIKLLSKYYRVAFYEELPYACVPDARDRALAEAREQLGIPLRLNLTWKCYGEILVKKQASISLYRSQAGVFPSELQAAEESLWLVNA